MLTIEDIRNPKRKSGFKHVGYSAQTPTCNHYKAQIGASSAYDGYWRGPRRKTPEEAAQDYCDYANSNNITVPVKKQAAPKPLSLMLNQAGHPRRKPDRVQMVATSKRQRPRQGTENVMGTVYLIGEAGNDVDVKIGWSKDDHYPRLSELQTGNPRILIGLAEKPGTKADERALHIRYEADNVLQEWFEVSDELLDEFGLDRDDFDNAVSRTQRKVGVK